MEETRLKPIAYTYAIHWKKYNKSYYGVRYAKNADPRELWVKYFTSSIHVKNFREKCGEPDIILIDQMFTDINEAREYEEWMLKEYDVVDNDDWLNKTDRRGFPVLIGDKNPMKRPEVKAKISGENHPMKRPELRGENHPMKRPEVKAKISGENHHMKRPEVRAKISGKNNYWYGKKRPNLSGENHPMKRPELREKISGENSPLYDDVIRVFFHPDYGKFIGTQHALGKMFELNSSNVCRLVKRKRKQHKGWTYHGEYQPEQPES